MQEHMRDTRFNPKVWIHKKSYVPIEGFTKNWVSLNLSSLKVSQRHS
jgi:hypothetical protein